MQKAWQGHRSEIDGVVDEEVIAEVVSKMTGVPLTRLEKEEAARLLELETELHKRVISQEEAISAVARSVRRSRSGMKDPNRPMGSFIFIGPSGVGKTLLAKCLAEFMFGSEESLVSMDMSEYMEKHNISRLIGAPPGYIGYEEGGQLTERIRRRPYAVVLLDEIEKAHPDCFNMLLQIMEEGHLSDARGRTVDFRNAIIIMTSNVGADMIKRQASLGFSRKQDEKSEERDYEEMRDKLIGQLKRVFRPEFLNRVDATIVFKSLSKEEITEIVDLELRKVQERLAEHQITLQVTDEAKRLLADEGYDPDYGARPLRRVIQYRVEDALSDALLAGEFDESNTIVVDTEDNKIVLHPGGEEPEETEALAEMAM
jgi:ATP-dependent Clp protease ATP-binding subunit ClpC